MDLPDGWCVCAFVGKDMMEVGIEKFGGERQWESRSEVGGRGKEGGIRCSLREGVNEAREKDIKALFSFSVYG